MENSTPLRCQTILVPDVAKREKKKILPHKTCSNGKTPRLPPSNSLKQSDDFLKLFVRANVAVLPGNKIAQSNERGQCMSLVVTNDDKEAKMLPRKVWTAP